jgi:hypothetical protein
MRSRWFERLRVPGSKGGDDGRLTRQFVRMARTRRRGQGSGHVGVGGRDVGVVEPVQDPIDCAVVED